MNPTVRVAVKMQPLADADSTFKATLPVGVLFEKSLDPTNLETERAALEEKYRTLVKTLRQMRPTLHTGNVLRYWFFGDTVTQFERGQGALFVDKLSDHLERDVHYSKTMIDLCRRFRQKFSDPAQINPRLTFSQYHRAGFNPSRVAQIARRRAGAFKRR